MVDLGEELDALAAIEKHTRDLRVLVDAWSAARTGTGTGDTPAAIEAVLVDTFGVDTMTDDEVAGLFGGLLTYAVAFIADPRARQVAKLYGLELRT